MLTTQHLQLPPESSHAVVLASVGIYSVISSYPFPAQSLREHSIDPASGQELHIISA